jgi:hypothetical protein
MAFKAQYVTDPQEPPHNRPSLLIKSLEQRKDSESTDLYHKSTRFLSNTVGIKSYLINNKIYYCKYSKEINFLPDSFDFIKS